MKQNEPSPQSNDYAVARVLNDSLNGIFSIISLYQTVGPLGQFDPDEMNRVYIFLVNEIEAIYDRNPKLLDIKPEPIWRHFEILKRNFLTIQHYIEENDHRQDHDLRLEKLCILSGQETAYLTAKQKKYVDDAKRLLNKYTKLAFEEFEKLPEDNSQEELEKDPRNRRFWCIEEYSVIYKPDGTILVNNVLKLKRIHAGSTAERLLEQSVKNPNKLFKPKLGQTARNLSTVLSSAGFNPTLREIFFPIVSQDKGVIFRPLVTRNEVIDERIDTFELDTMLYEAGSKAAVRPAEELIALGIAAPDDDE